ncbi:MAG: leucine-rich repeat protein [Sedimentibacter sp.]
MSITQLKITGGEFITADWNYLKSLSKMTNFEMSDGVTVGLIPVATYSKPIFPATIITVNIPNVTQIGNYAFCEAKSLTTVDMPDVTQIGEAAFYECVKLNYISIDKVNDISIGSLAFYCCRGLVTVNMPNATILGQKSFIGCTELTTVNMPKVTDISAHVFAYCTELKTTNFPNAETVGEIAFEHCLDLETINMPKVTDIGALAFEQCIHLETLKLGATPPTIGDGTFDSTVTTKQLVFLDGDGTELTGTELSTAQNSYKEDENDGDTSDNLWYGWTIISAEDEAAAELEAVESAVAEAESTKTDATRTAAQDLIDALADGDVKTALQERLDAIETTEDEAAADKSSSSSNSKANPTITVEKSNGGITSIGKNKKDFTIIPDDGYVIADVMLDGKNIGATEIYTFTDNKKHTIEPNFVKETTIPYYVKDKQKIYIGFSGITDELYNYIAPISETVEFGENTKNFNDNTLEWAKQSIDFVTEREIFLGTSEEMFSPDNSMTRAMFVTAMGRLYERSYGMEAGTSIFSDVDADAYYAKYVAWASENGIVKGIGESEFAPNDKVTREQMAVIMLNSAKILENGDFKDSSLEYVDSTSISSWAIDGAKYCQETKLITDREDGKFAPKESVTRAEVAVAIDRFIKTIIK